jgi:hypothetical protein
MGVELLRYSEQERDLAMAQAIGLMAKRYGSAERMCSNPELKASMTQISNGFNADLAR